MHGMEGQLSKAPVGSVAQHVKQSAALHLPQNAMSASKQSATAESYKLHLLPAALQHNQVVPVTDAEPAESAQVEQRGAATGVEATDASIPASNAALAHWTQDGKALPCPEHFPVSLLQYDQAWAASVGCSAT